MVLGRADGSAEVLDRPGAAAPTADIAELMRNQDA